MAIEQRDRRIIIRSRSGQKEIKLKDQREAREMMNKVNYIRSKNESNGGGKSHHDED